MKKSILVTILTAIMLIALVGSVNAANVTATPEKVKAGETVTITVTPSEARDGVQFDVAYNADELEYVETAKPEGMEVMDEVANGTGRIMVYSMNGKTTASVKMTFKVLKDITVEEANVTITGFVSGEEKVATVGTAKIAVEKVDDTKDPVKDPDDTKDPVKDPDDTKNPTDINGKPIEEHPQTGAPIYVVAVAVIVIAAVAVLAIRKNK